MKKYTLSLCILIVNLTLGYAQKFKPNQHIKLPAESVSGMELIKQIETQSQHSVSYSSSYFKVPETVQFQTKRPKLQICLDKLLANSGNEYVLKNQKIFIRPKAKSTKKSSDKTEEKLILEGKVLDSKTKESIPYAHVRVKNSSLAVMTNREGNFKIILPLENITDSLEVSFMGYINYTAAISDLDKKKSITVKLKEQHFKIAEVKVKPPNPYKILKKAIKRIPKNYPTEPHYLNAYYRELMMEDSVYVKFNDADCKIYYSEYGVKQNLKKNRSRFTGVYHFDLYFGNSHFFPNYRDEVIIRKNRISSNWSKHGYDVKNDDKHLVYRNKIAGGPLVLTGFDPVKMRNRVLHSKFKKYYNLKITEGKKDNYNCFIIDYSAKGKNSNYWSKGKVYIDKETYAFVAITNFGKFQIQSKYPNWAFVNPKENKKGKTKYIKLERYIEPNVPKRTIHYKLRNNKWYLDKIIFEGGLKNYGEIFDTIRLNRITELQVYSIDTSNVKSFNKNKTFPVRWDFPMEEYQTKYDSSFWNNYNKNINYTIPAKLKQDLEKEIPLEKQFAQRVAYNPHMIAPRADIISHKTKNKKDTRIDNYHWLKHKDSIRTTHYLQAEELYTQNYLLAHSNKKRRLYYEMLDRIDKNFVSVPFMENAYKYYTKYYDSLNHAQFYRIKDTLNAVPQLILDENKLAHEHSSYYMIEELIISPSHQLLAYGENTTGGMKNCFKIKHINKDSLLKDELHNVSSFTWANDSTVYYSYMDKSFRSYKIYKHKLGQLQELDELIFHEKDSTFNLDIYKSRSKELLFMESYSKTENETRYLKLSEPEKGFQLIQKRKEGLQYYVSHMEDSLYIESNYNCPEYQLFTTSLDNPKQKNWNCIIPYSDKSRYLSHILFKDYMVVHDKLGLDSRIRIINRKTKEEYRIPVEEKIYSMGFSGQNKYESDSLQFYIGTPTSPSRIYKMHLENHGKRLVRKQKVLGKFKESDYKSERLWATSHDGTKVPITIVYKKKWKQKEFKNGKRRRAKRKLYIRGYGAYGISTTAGFSSSDLSLLNRGYTIAYAHVRGGSELGKTWYEQGKLLNKKNTFEDFIACTKHLIDKGYAKKGEVVAEGGSAGGLLMGVMANEYPEYFKVLIFDVPFVDVLNTMLDKSRPLTTGEYKEWGNPNKKKYYKYIKSYCPYSNVKKQDYPSMLFMSYMNDQNAPYFESAKMVAKLRAMKTDKNTILLNINENGGHAGTSGRFDGLKDKALKIAFILNEMSK